MIKVECYSFFSNNYVTYLRPTLQQAADNMKKTYGISYDKIERMQLTGGISTRWPKLIKEI